MNPLARLFASLFHLRQLLDDLSNKSSRPFIEFLNDVRILKEAIPRCLNKIVSTLCGAFRIQKLCIDLANDFLGSKKTMCPRVQVKKGTAPALFDRAPEQQDQDRFGVRSR